MTPAVEVRVWRDNGSAAGEKSIWSPLVTDADLGRSLHLPGGFAVRQGDTPYLISPNARLLNDQDEKGSLHPTGSPITYGRLDRHPLITGSSAFLGKAGDGGSADA